MCIFSRLNFPHSGWFLIMNRAFSRKKGEYFDLYYIEKWKRKGGQRFLGKEKSIHMIFFSKRDCETAWIRSFKKCLFKIGILITIALERDIMSQCILYYIVYNMYCTVVYCKIQYVLYQNSVLVIISKVLRR